MPGGVRMTDATADQTFRAVMTVEPPALATPLAQATREFVFGQVWPRPGLSRRDRRWITLTCVAAADAPQPIDDHVYAALNSGDTQAYLDAAQREIGALSLANHVCDLVQAGRTTVQEGMRLIGRAHE